MWALCLIKHLTKNHVRRKMLALWTKPNCWNTNKIPFVQLKHYIKPTVCQRISDSWYSRECWSVLGAFRKGRGCTEWRHICGKEKEIVTVWKFPSVAQTRRPQTPRRGREGVVRTNVQNTKICCRLFRTGYHSSNRRQYFLSLLCDVGVTSLRNVTCKGAACIPAGFLG